MSTILSLFSPHYQPILMSFHGSSFDKLMICFRGLIFKALRTQNIERVMSVRMSLKIDVKLYYMSRKQLPILYRNKLVFCFYLWNLSILLSNTLKARAIFWLQFFLRFTLKTKRIYIYYIHIALYNQVSFFIVTCAPMKIITLPYLNYFSTKKAIAAQA